MPTKIKLSDVPLSKCGSKRERKHTHRNEAAMWQKKQRRKAERGKRKAKRKLKAVQQELTEARILHKKELFLARLDGKLAEASFWMGGADQ